MSHAIGDEHLQILVSAFKGMLENLFSMYAEPIGDRNQPNDINMLGSAYMMCPLDFAEVPVGPVASPTAPTPDYLFDCDWYNDFFPDDIPVTSTVEAYKLLLGCLLHLRWPGLHDT